MNVMSLSLMNQSADWRLADVAGLFKKFTQLRLQIDMTYNLLSVTLLNSTIGHVTSGIERL